MNQRTVLALVALGGILLIGRMIIHHEPETNITRAELPDAGLSASQKSEEVRQAKQKAKDEAIAQLARYLGTPVPLKTFKAAFEKGKSTRFLVMAELDDYYNYDYMYARNTAYSIRIYADREDIHGYVKKSSDLGKMLFERLRDGKRHPAILELLYKDSSQSSTVATIADSVSNETELDQIIEATREAEN